MRDLRTRLHDVVDIEPLPGARGATASDDVLVAVLTARVRRRRGLRAAATSALGVLVVAAVATGGVALAGREAGPAPATDVPDWRPPGCGATVDVTADPGDLWLGGELRSPTVTVGDPVDVRIVLRNQLGRAVVRLHGAFAHVLVLSEGVVVAHGLGPEDGRGSDGSEGSASHTFAGPIDLEACDGGELQAGEYQVVVAQAWADADGGSRYELTAGPWPFTVIADDDEIRMPLEAVTCGEPLPAELPMDPGLGATAEVAAAASADAVPWTVRWWSADARPVSVALADVQVAALRDGVVVGTTGSGLTWEGTGEGMPTSEDSPRVFADATALTDCAGAPLPPGRYEVLVTLTLATTHDEVLRASLGPWPLTLTPAGAAPTAPAASTAPACGDAVSSPGIAPPDAPLYVNGAVQREVVRGLVVPVAALVASTADADLAWPHTAAALAVTRGGVVVATAAADLLPDAVPAGSAALGPVLDVTLIPCDGAPLPAGAYVMWLHATFELPMGPVEILEGDWPFTIEAS